MIVIRVLESWYESYGNKRKEPFVDPHGIRHF